MQLPDAHVLSGVLEMLKLGKSEALAEESWPPPKILARLASELKNIASTVVMDKKKEHTKEPVIIDLLSD